MAGESNKNGSVQQEELKTDTQNNVPLPTKPAAATPVQPPAVAKAEQSAKVSPCDECGASIV